MKTILGCTLLLAMINLLSEGRELIKVCGGSDVVIFRKEDKTDISKWKLYFNGKEIGYWFYENITVNTLYKDRIEGNITTGITLKNVSRKDEGVYTLSFLMKSSIDVITRINDLSVLDLTSNQTASYYGRPMEKSISEENPGESMKDVLCCLDGNVMKYDDYKKQYCTNADKRPSDDGRTQSTESESKTVCRNTDDLLNDLQNHKIVHFVLVGVIVLLLAVIGCLLYYIQRKNKQFERIRAKREIEEGIPKNKPIDNSQTENKLQKQQIVPLHPRPETEENITMNNYSETEIEMELLEQQQQHITLHSELENISLDSKLGSTEVSL